MAIDKEIYYKEHVMLRQELHDLKECQIKFLTFSVTVTGVLLSLAVSLTYPLPSAYLFPLTILVPSWWIFFDKATTITRIVGYYRILEKAILEPGSVESFIGWENALAKFRELQLAGELTLPRGSVEKRPIRRFIELVVLKTTHCYWVLTYYTFFGLSVLCLALSLYQGANIVLVSLAAIMIMISAVWNARVVSNLIWGRNSYTANEFFWRKILKVNYKGGSSGVA